MSTFAWEPVRGEDVLARMGTVPEGQPVRMLGDDWGQAALTTLFHAEMLAARAGVVPFFTLPDGTQGIVNVGAAREKIDRAPSDVRTIYLGAHGAVRATHARAQNGQASTMPLPGYVPTVNGLETIGLPIVVPIVIGVVALAAVIAGAWYMTRKAEIEVDGRNLRTTSAASTIAAMAHEQLTTKGAIDPGLYEVLKAYAGAESQVGAGLPSWLLPAAGGVVVLGGGVWALSKFNVLSLARRAL